MNMIKIISYSGKAICTDPCPEIKHLLELEGIPWFEALQKPIIVSENLYEKIDTLITPA